MRLIHYVILTAAALISFEICKAETLTKDEKRVAQEFGYRPLELVSLKRDLKTRLDIDRELSLIALMLEKNSDVTAILADQALLNAVLTATHILKLKGHYDLAEEITFEYDNYYRQSFLNLYLGFKEIGDHPPVFEWLETVHKKVHDALGDFLCKYFRLHDIFILNHANVVFFPKMAKDLKDYKDHFAGHPILGFFWEHHGFAGVVTYWIVNGVCIGATYGAGAIPLLCGPIAGVAERIMDKRIAPPIAETIYKRIQFTP